MEDVVLVSAVRTPIGAFQGAFKEIPAPKLGAEAIRAAVERAGIPAEAIEECLMGCVLTAGVGQAPARQATIFGGLPSSVRATTVNRVCGSGLKSVMLAAQAIQAGDAVAIVAGGMESMSRAPYLLEKARDGYRMGHGKLVDSMIGDGLWDVYNQFHMGEAAELCASEKRFSREEQDRFARQSYQRAQKANQEKIFAAEMIPITIEEKKEKRTIDTDEEPFRAKLDKFQELRPAFKKDGTVTAANASSLNDGASALVVCSASFAKAHGLKPMARIVAQASHAQAPEWFTTAPIGAIKKALEKAKKSVADIDLFEVNEAFAVVALACAQELKIDETKMNICGGAVALGHPIGASGARILTTLLWSLKRQKAQFGLATLCIGGGEGSAVVVENLG